MKMVIVPNELSEAIYRKVDAAIAESPDASVGRETFFQMLLEFFDEHGYIPEFSLKRYGVK